MTGKVWTGRTGEVLGFSDQKSKSLAGCSGAKIIAKLVAAASMVFDVDKNQVVQVNLPPAAGFANISGGVDFDAESSHDFSAQFTFSRRGVNQEYSLLSVCAGDGRRNLGCQQRGRHAGTDLGDIAAEPFADLP
jgi:hypothetical protein